MSSRVYIVNDVRQVFPVTNTVIGIMSTGRKGHILAFEIQPCRAARIATASSARPDLRSFS